jgi:hypothetical protein
MDQTLKKLMGSIQKESRDQTLRHYWRRASLGKVDPALFQLFGSKDLEEIRTSIQAYAERYGIPLDKN